MTAFLSHGTLAPTVSLRELGPDTFWTCDAIEQVALPDASPGFRLTDAACCVMTESWKCRANLEVTDTPIYGVTTGFGPFICFSSGDDGTGKACHGAGLLDHLGAGWSPANTHWIEPEVVRAAMWIRAQNLAQGFSGIRPELLHSYLSLPLSGITPCVPPVGSVGASGDLIPLAHIAQAVVGAESATVLYQGVLAPASEVLDEVRISPPSLDGRDALALTNGTSVLTAHAALAVARAERLLHRAELLTGWMYRTLYARSAALDDRLHRARGHAGQIQSAANIRQEAERYGAYEDTSRALQEVYSLRCAPQVLGACRENLTYARRIVEQEINGASDNPLFFASDNAVVHGGNFHGQQVAFAADALNAALTQAAVLAERQIDALVTPSATNSHAPLLLAWEPGVSSGLAGAQITATSLVAEMRSRAQMHATYSIPTNGNNQDVVSMGALAARTAFEQAERLSAVLAILGIALVQLNFLRREGRATGQPSPIPSWMHEFEGLRGDRPLRRVIDRTARQFLME